MTDGLAEDVNWFCVGYERALQGNPHANETALGSEGEARYLSWNLSTRERLVPPAELADDFVLFNENFQLLIDFVKNNNATLADFAALSEEESAFFNFEIEEKFDDYWWGTCVGSESPWADS